MGQPIDNISDEQARSLTYFWEEKGDFRRTSTYDEVKHILKDKYQSLYDGERFMEQGRIIIEATLKRIENDSYEED